MGASILLLKRVTGRLIGGREASGQATIRGASKPVAAKTRSPGMRLRAIRRALGRRPVVTVTILLAAYLIFRMSLSYALASKGSTFP